MLAYFQSGILRPLWQAWVQDGRDHRVVRTRDSAREDRGLAHTGSAVRRQVPAQAVRKGFVRKAARMRVLGEDMDFARRDSAHRAVRTRDFV